MKYFQVLVDEAFRDKRIVELKTRDAINDDMARKILSVKCSSGDGVDELGRSVKVQRMLAANRGEMM